MSASILNQLNGPAARRVDPGNDHGFTLIELMIAMAIAAIVIAAIVGIFKVLSRDYTTQNVSAQVQQQVRDGIDLVVKDIRLAGLDPLKTADAGFGTITATSIDIRADRDGNGVIDARGEEITYFYNGSQLIRRFGGLASTDMAFANNVTDLTFTYLDQNDAVTSDPLEIRTVGISMSVQQPAGPHQQVQRAYSMRVRCRNIGL